MYQTDEERMRNLEKAIDAVLENRDAPELELQLRELKQRLREKERPSQPTFIGCPP